MQQAEHADSNGAVSPAKDVVDVLDQESDQPSEENVVSMQQKVYVINSAGMLLIGLLLSYFPQYVQANVPVINTGAEIFALLFFAACGKIFYDAYPRFFTHDNIMLLGSVVLGVVGYLLSDPGKSYMHTTVDIFVVPRTITSMDVILRIISFASLVTLVGTLSLRAPNFIQFYEQRKGKLWSSITSKKNIAPILGGLSVVTALCTALLQIMQIVSSLLHL